MGAIYECSRSHLIDFAGDIESLRRLRRWRSDCSASDVEEQEERRLSRVWPRGSGYRGADLGTSDGASPFRCLSFGYFLAGATPNPFPAFFLRPEYEDLRWGLDVLHDTPFKRSSERHATKKQASLIMNSRGRLQRHPCLIVDISRAGYRVRGSFQVKRGQLVEVIPKDDPLSVARCSVIWVGKQGTAQQGQAGLEAMN